MPLKVLSVASEVVPLVKTGGLADVVGRSPPPSQAMAWRPRPWCLGILLCWRLLAGGQRLFTPGIPPRHAGAVAHRRTGRGHPLLVLDAPALYAREGAPYTDAAGRDWGDNWQRFAALSRAAADLAGGAMSRRGKPLGYDLLHAHDWQAALAPAYLRYAPFSGRAVPSVITVHNIAFQGWFGAEVFPQLGLPGGLGAGRRGVPWRRRDVEGGPCKRRRGHDGKPDLRPGNTIRRVRDGT
ncbi:glycogen/starch synthase [Novosphingobium panipatense]